MVITRAKERLYLTYANNRYRFGSLMQNEPSRFLEEMPSEHIDHRMAGGSLRNSSPGRSFGGVSAYERMHRGQSAPAKSPEQVRERPTAFRKGAPAEAAHVPSPDFAPSDPQDFEAGMQVEHLKFGFGTILQMEGNSRNRIATIHFALTGEKKIMLNYAKLRIVPAPGEAQG